MFAHRPRSPESQGGVLPSEPPELAHTYVRVEYKLCIYVSISITMDFLHL